MKNTLILILVSAFAATAGAETLSYKLPITRDGVTTTRVAYSFWSGEYPGPVIRIGAGEPGGLTMVSAYKSLRKLNQPVSCTVKNGVYHPWSATENSIDLYYTLVPVNEFVALKTTVLNDGQDNFTVKKGQIVNPIYGSEGWCSVDLDGQAYGVFCDDIYGSSNFEKISPDDDFYEQWLYLDCAEGYKAFAQDSSLLEQKNVEEGEITGYGEVR